MIGKYDPVERECPNTGDAPVDGRAEPLDPLDFRWIGDEIQDDRDYVFDSSKFEKRFGLEAIAPKEGIKKLIESF